MRTRARQRRWDLTRLVEQVHPPGTLGHRMATLLARAISTTEIVRLPPGIRWTQNRPTRGRRLEGRG